MIALRGPGSDSFALRLLPLLEPATFPLSKLAPQRNNLRAPAPSAPAGQAPVVPQTDEASLLPTPSYNSAVLQVSLEAVHPHYCMCDSLPAGACCRRPTGWGYWWYQSTMQKADS